MFQCTQVPPSQGAGVPSLADTAAGAATSLKQQVQQQQQAAAPLASLVKAPGVPAAQGSLGDAAAALAPEHFLQPNDTNSSTLTPPPSPVRLKVGTAPRSSVRPSSIAADSQGVLEAQGSIVREIEDSSSSSELRGAAGAMMPGSNGGMLLPGSSAALQPGATSPNMDLPAVSQAGAGQAGPGFPQQSGEQLQKNLQDRQQYIQKQQRWLLFLRHCGLCQQGECQVGHSCSVGKELWAHMSSCSNAKCTYRHCNASRDLVHHYEHSQNVQCPICAPVREYLQRTAAQTGAAGGMPGSAQPTGNMGSPTQQQQAAAAPMASPARTPGSPQQFSEQLQQNLQDEEQYILKKQRWLLFLRHCGLCQQGEDKCQLGHHCSGGKELWTHILSCNKSECTYPHCNYSRDLVHHDKYCQDVQCPICAPVREYLQRTAAQAGAAGGMPGSAQPTGSMASSMQQPQQPAAAAPLASPAQAPGFPQQSSEQLQQNLQDQQQYIQEQQQWLRFLLHCVKHHLGENEGELPPACRAGKELCVHMLSYNNPECTYQRCTDSKALMSTTRSARCGSVAQEVFLASAQRQMIVQCPIYVAVGSAQPIDGRGQRIRRDPDRDQCKQESGCDHKAGANDSRDTQAPGASSSFEFDNGDQRIWWHPDRDQLQQDVDCNYEATAKNSGRDTQAPGASSSCDDRDQMHSRLPDQQLQQKLAQQQRQAADSQVMGRCQATNGHPTAQQQQQPELQGAVAAESSSIQRSSAGGAGWPALLAAVRAGNPLTVDLAELTARVQQL
uniref:histone acetyltransferase n=1 Tax=Tetradesmus obliquus TaxID=3088 RepID=A0A383VQ25_TETOB|eukprot:jgi/Sobl393_1/11521/SZX66939.1